MSSTRIEGTFQDCYNVQSRLVTRQVKTQDETQLTPRPVRSKLTRKQARVNLRQLETKNNNVDSIDWSMVPLLIASPEKPRREPIFSSTVIESRTLSDYSPSVSVIRSPIHQLDKQEEYPDIQNAFCNYLYESPSTTPVKKSFNTSFSSCSDEGEFRTCSASMFAEPTDWSEIHICRESYQARSPGELSVQFSDRLRFVQVSSSSDEWCLVQNIDTGIYGYVPQDNICTADSFLVEVQRRRL